MTNSKSVDPAHNTENVSAVLLDKWLHEFKLSFNEKMIDNDEVIAALLKRIDSLEAANLAKDKEIADLKQKNGQNSGDFSSAAFWSRLTPAATQAISNIATKETCNIQSREKNLVISGITESGTTNNTEKHDEDNKKVIELIGKLGLGPHGFDEDLIKRQTAITRLKPKPGTNKPGFILVRCGDVDLKMLILKSAKKLKEMDGYRDVYINCDLTNVQLEIEKKLRTERNDKNKALEFTGQNGQYGKQKLRDGSESKFYWGIRSGELRKIKFL
jgi:hypothetical protein